MRKVLAFTAAAEFGTGVALIIDPTLVVGLLVGASLSGGGIPLGRVAGIALVGLGVACWPGAGAGPGAIRAMLIYNALVALYLGYLGTVGHMGGPLLWPAAVLHAVVAVLLAWPRRGERPT